MLFKIYFQLPSLLSYIKTSAFLQYSFTAISVNIIGISIKSATCKKTSNKCSYESFTLALIKLTNCVEAKCFTCKLECRDLYYLCNKMTVMKVCNMKHGEIGPVQTKKKKKKKDDLMECYIKMHGRTFLSKIRKSFILVYFQIT